MDIILRLLGYKWGWRKVRVGCWAITLIGSLFLILPFVFQGFTREAGRQAFTNSGAALPLLTIGIFGLLLAPIYQRQIMRFRASLDPSGGNVSLVANQPTPDNTALTLPTTISLRVRWPAALMWGVILPAVFIACMIGAAALGSFLGALESSSFIWIASFATALLIPLCMFYFPFALLRTIHVTEEEIFHQQSSYRDSVSWDDMRIFAIVEGGKRPGSSATYILGSGRNNVRWTHRARTRWFSIVAPTTSDEEYQRQMEALLSYAAARTGLPLLDMR